MNRIDMIAVAKLAVNMARADGNLAPSEIDAIANGFVYFGIGQGEAQKIVLATRACSNNDAEIVVSRLSDADKEFVSAWLLSVIVADGVVDAREKAYFQKLIVSCGLRNLSLDVARTNVKNRKVVCYRVICGSSDYDFRTEDEAQRAMAILSGGDPVMDDFLTMVKTEVEANHGFWTLEQLIEKERREREEEEWQNQPMFIANSLDGVVF
jgi:uncharacterized tellurite resistance protein B-like protein